MNEELYEKDNYLINEKFICGSSIYEYDIKQANINVLYYQKLIDYNLYMQLSAVRKDIRERYIGLLEKDEKTNGQLIDGKSATYVNIKNGIKLAKQMLFSTNNIQDCEVVRIANDAVYIRRFVALKNTVFDNIEFKCKGHYSSFLSFPMVQLFIGVDENEYNVSVIGINDDKLELHQCMLSFICEMVLLKEKGDILLITRKFEEFYKSYLNLQLPIEYYREFKSSSSFKIKGFSNLPYIISPMIGDDIPKDKLDISYNLGILRDLYTYLLT